jgi:hypothetical protein
MSITISLSNPPLFRLRIEIEMTFFLNSPNEFTLQDIGVRWRFLEKLTNGKMATQEDTGGHHLVVSSV